MTALRPALPLRPLSGRRRESATQVPRAPWPLLASAVVVGGLALLPIGYLVLRAADVESAALAFLLRPRTLETVAATFVLALGVGAGSIAIGLPVAWLTTRTNIPARRAWAVLTVIPLAIPSYVIAFAFLAAFGPRGSLQGLLAPLGVERLPSIGGLAGAVLVLTLVTFPYVVLATRAALLRLDPATEDTARLLGDRGVAVFRRVTLPALVPAMAAGALLAVLYALSDFGAVALLQFDSLSRSIYLQYAASFDRALAALLALVLVAMTLLVTAGEARLRRRAGSWASRPPRRPPPVVRLGGWRWPAMCFLGALVALSLVVPAATIAWWLVRGALAAETLRFEPRVVVDTFVVGLAAAVGAVLLALPTALLAVRHRSRLSGFVVGSTNASYALPGIVVALAMVFMATRTMPILYQTLALLVAVYAVRLVPQAFGGLRAALLAAGPGIEEAGRILGDGPIRAFVSLTVPYLRPALVSGATLVFLTVVKELPLALLLGPIGFETLATEVWDAASSGFYARAAVPAALLLALSVSTVSILLRSEGDTR